MQRLAIEESMARDEKDQTDQETDNLLSEESPSLNPNPECCDRRRPCRPHWVVVFFSILSLLLNILLVVLLVNEKREKGYSPYVGLQFGTIQTISHLGPYGSENKNETERAILWESLDTSDAQVAVDKSWAASQGLPSSQEFTWDKSKAVYSLRGFHGQHCLRKIHRWVTISYHGGTQLDMYEHVLHCLDSLLQDIRCFADDTPMISTPGSWGEGQQRKCRDWKKLQQWAQAHNACFAYINETQGVASMFDRYKWCPPNSPYGARMRSVLRLPEDWDSTPPKEIDSLPAYWDHFE